MLKKDDLAVLTGLVRSGLMSEAALARVLRETTMDEAADASAPLDPKGDTDDWPPDATSPVVTNLPLSHRYELLELIGEGGTGSVFRARDLLLERDVAVKVISPSKAKQAAPLHRFIYEARITGLLSHPGIIPVHDIGQLGDGKRFYCMERVSGRDLRAVLEGLIAGAPEMVAAFPLKRLLRVYSQVCMTVAFAHDHGVIHRDLKPANIMLGEYGEVYVADWGLAKRFQGDDAGSIEHRPGRATQAGALLGTVFYMSPEQVQGKVEELGPATDIYALGTILYELLTLRHPYEDYSLIKAMFAITEGERRDPRDEEIAREVPDVLAELALEAMAFESSQRCSSARHMANVVEAFLDGVEDQERKAAWSRDSSEKAQEEYAAYLARKKAIAIERTEVRKADALPIDAPIEQRIEIWRRRQRLSEAITEAELVFGRALRMAENAHELAADKHSDLLVELYWLKAREAERVGDPTAVLFRGLAERYASGERRSLFADEGVLEIHAPEACTELSLSRLEPMGPVFEETALDMDFDEPLSLPVGTYMVRATVEGQMPYQMPVVVRGEQPRRLAVSAPTQFAGWEEFAFVPGARVTLGGDSKAPQHLPATEYEIGGFLMARYPVTLEQYCEFLNAVAVEDIDRAMGHAPREFSGKIWLGYEESTRTFFVPEVDEDGDAWDPKWPAHLLAVADAEAYCMWRSQRDGAVIRLPTEFEWEYAARGVDERLFPWGNGFDPILCASVEAVGGKALPTPVGSFPYDRSPFGVMDMAGLIIEHTSTAGQSADTVVARGGAVRSPRDWCRACARRENRRDLLHIVYGFRIVREI